MNFADYAGKRVVVTGHTGFKGSWLSLWLARLGAKVYGYALPPETKRSNYGLSRVRELLEDEALGDIRDRGAMAKAVKKWKPDAVFHLAAQPLVRLSYKKAYETFETNVLGTASVLDAVRARDADCATVCITTDKCYENRETARGYRETDAMGGYDPYSASKGAAEILIASYRRSFGMNAASARAGNVIGGGDWAKDRILPDIVRALKRGAAPGVRNPAAVRPWQHVLEPLSGYLTLGLKLMKEPHSEKWCSGWNFGPERSGEDTVGAVADLACRAWSEGGFSPKGKGWEFTGEPNAPHEANLLRLDIGKAKRELGWKPRWTLKEAVGRTVAWYGRERGGNARELCERDIEDYAAQK